MQALADEGLLERRRKGGTRVAQHPIRKAVLEIPITRLEVEQTGARHSYRLIARQHRIPPKSIAQQMKSDPKIKLLQLRALHLANNKPFLYEDRWLNPITIPDCLLVDFEQMNANEWLVDNALFSAGEITCSVATPNKKEIQLLNTSDHQAIFIIHRTTWMGEQSVTRVRLAYAPGYQLNMKI